MSGSDGSSAPLRAPEEDPLRDVPVDWDALEHAFEFSASSMIWYFDIVNGTVSCLKHGITDPSAYTAFATNPRQRRVVPVEPARQYQWMLEFIATLTDEALVAELRAASHGKGAFRRFKDALLDHPQENEAWRTFRSPRMRRFIRDWLIAHRLAVAPPPRPDQDAIEERRLQQEKAASLERLDNAASSLGRADLLALVDLALFLRGPERCAGASAQEPQRPDEAATTSRVER